MHLAVFDVDGTLLDNVASEDACYANALCEGLGLETLDSNWSSYEHVSDEGIAIEAYRRAFRSLPSRALIEGTIERFVAALREAHARQPIRPIAGASAMLSALAAHGWEFAFATGAWRRAAAFKLQAAGLMERSAMLATAEDGPSRVAIVHAAIQGAERLHGGSFDRIVLVGDALWDVAAARALGFPIVGRACGESELRLRAAGVRTILNDFSRLETVIGALESARLCCDPHCAGQQSQPDPDR